MSEKTIPSRIIHKHDTEENWLKAVNFTPKQGEIIIYDIDDNHEYERFKIGDGVTNVNILPFSVDIPFVNNVFSNDIIPMDNTIYVWEMTGNLVVTINANNCTKFPAHFVLYTGETDKVLTVDGAVVISGDDYTAGLPLNTRWEISVFNGQVLIKNMTLGLK